MYIHLGDGSGDTPSCSSTNCSAVSTYSFARQPNDLKTVLAKSSSNPTGWFEKLDPKNRFALTSIFNRLCRYKSWCYVIQLLKIVPGEAPFAGGRIDVPGSTPSVHFLSSSGDAMLKALMSSGRFCMAQGAGASQHPGQTSLREISQSDSMHVSIGPGNQFDAHIDLYSPVSDHPGSSFCSNLPTPAALRHIGRELVPEIVRKKTGIPGVQVFPDFEQTPRMPASRPDANPPPPVVGVTWRF